MRIQTRTCKDIVLFGAAVVLAICSSPSAFAQMHRVTNLTNASLGATAAFATLTPGGLNVPQSTQVQFRLRSRQATAMGGYRVDAQANFVPTLLASADGGSTISASDIGVGITSITAASNVDMPRADLIAPGFAYDPAGVTSTNGLTPFGGVATGRATLGDLASSRKILNGNRIAPNVNNGPASVNYLTVTMKFAVLPQYFTPATFAALVTLTISNGP